MQKLQPMLVRRFFGVLATVLAITTFAVAQETPQRATYVKIKNFGQMDDRFFRGAQPKTEEDYKALAALGIKTIIDLTDDPKEYEKPLVESLGMKYVHIPMIAKKYPTPAATEAFLKTVNDPSTGKFYLHCAGGRHRTGAMGAVYRYEFYNWDFDKVYQEMKQYDFYTSWGHGAFKDFVRDYHAKKQGNNANAAEAPQKDDKQ
ncbi:MAG TPA: tyrosine-protein phosphatase [Pyrinomonadaceae bacterium]|nr:tyrosine-protein phosphatase [Pyrinomonadaceae bacterium]